MYHNILLKKAYCRIRSIPIFYRLLTSFLVVILIPALIVIGILYQQVEEEFYQTGLNYIDQNLDNTVQKTYEAFRSYEDSIAAFVQTEEIGVLLKGQRMAELNEALIRGKQKLECDNLYLITEKELIEADHLARLADAPAFRRSDLYRESIASLQTIKWYNTIRDQSTYYTNEKKASYMGNFLTITTRLNMDGTFLGLLVLNVDIARMSALANIDKVYHQDQFLVDENGVITYLNIDYVYRDYPEWIWKEAAREEQNLISCQVQGRKTLFLSKNMGKNNWKVVSVIWEDNLLKASYKLRNQQILIVCLTIVFSLLFCILVTVTIAHPLRKIKTAMQQYAVNDFALTLEDVGSDEITEVSARFQDMSKRIGELAEKEILSERAIAVERFKQKEMTLSALQMQINPHFLYNTLDLIRWNVMELENGNDRISRMIGSYSAMLRYNIRLEDGFSTIREELEYTKKYIDLLNMLYQTSIRLEIAADNEAFYEIRIGKLFFQPVIENAVIHGKLNKTEAPFLRIAITQTDQLIISIQNNGKLITDERIALLNEAFVASENKTARVGLYNINQRIKLLFGEAYGLRVARENGLTCFNMSLPCGQGDGG